MYMYVLLLLQVFKSSCNCRKLLYCSRLSKLFNDDNQTAIAARPCTVGVSLSQDDLLCPNLHDIPVDTLGSNAIA